MALSPDELRVARDSYTVAFRQLVRLSSRENRPLICVVEGKDAGYYHPRVQFWMISNAINRDLEFINSCGRSNALKVRDAVDKNEAVPGDLCLYFLNRDVHPIGSDGARIDTYVTDGYSVENYYASGCAVRAILCHYCFNNALTEEAQNRVERAIIEYEELLNEFTRSSFQFNCWVWAQRRNYKERVPLRRLDKKSYIHVSIEQGTAKLLVEDLDLNGLPRPDLHPSKDEIEKASDEIAEAFGGARCRGKQILLFVTLFLEDLIRLFRKPGSEYFVDACAPVQISIKSFIGDFSQFAETPRSMLEFLEEYHAVKIAA